MTAWTESFEGSDGQVSRSRHDRDNVVQALERLERSERDAVDELREAICGFVGSLRGEGASGEQVKEAVRALIATPASTEGALNLAPAVREALVELAVHWCSDEYDKAKKSVEPPTT
jgi:hypothetical protein